MRSRTYERTRMRIYARWRFSSKQVRGYEFCQLVSVCTYVRAQAQKNNPPKSTPLSEKWQPKLFTSVE